MEIKFPGGTLMNGRMAETEGYSLPALLAGAVYIVKKSNSRYERFDISVIINLG